MKINKKIIAELTGYLKEFNLSEIEYSDGTTKVKVSKSINNSSVIPSEIKINNEVQNRVLLKGNSPSKLVIRNESYGKVLFKNIILKKL